MGIHDLLKRVRTRRREVQVVFFGLDGSGKTSIIRAMRGEAPGPVPPTTDFDVHKIAAIDFRLELWDIGGGPDHRDRWTDFLPHASTVVWVIDSSDRVRFPDAHAEFRRLVAAVGDTSSLLVLANPIGGRSIGDSDIARILDLASVTTVAWKVLPCDPCDPTSVQRVVAWICDDLNTRFPLPDDSSS
jgi:signal recognition particle receptor subunit beta